MLVHVCRCVSMHLCMNVFFLHVDACISVSGVFVLRGISPFCQIFTSVTSVLFSFFFFPALSFFFHSSLSSPCSLPCVCVCLTLAFVCGNGGGIENTTCHKSLRGLPLALHGRVITRPEPLRSLYLSFRPPFMQRAPF